MDQVCQTQHSMVDEMKALRSKLDQTQQCVGFLLNSVHNLSGEVSSLRMQSFSQRCPALQSTYGDFGAVSSTDLGAGSDVAQNDGLTGYGEPAIPHFHTSGWLPCHQARSVATTSLLDMASSQNDVAR